MEKANAILLFYGVLERGVSVTAPRFAAVALRPLRERYHVSVACLDLAVDVVDGLRRPRCPRAHQLLGCDFVETLTEKEMRASQREIRDLRFRKYSANASARALNQLVAEAAAARLARRAARETGAEFVFAVSSDFYFVNALPPITMRAGTVSTSSQMDGDNGYTNGLYVGRVTDVARVMGRIDVVPACCLDLNHDYERLLRVAGFKAYNLTRQVIYNEDGSPFTFFKVRATCRVFWPIGWYSRMGRNPATRPAYRTFLRLSSSLSRNASCMSSDAACVTRTRRPGPHLLPARFP